MSLMDDVNQLRALVTKVPTGQIEVLKNQVIEINAKTAGVIGSTAGFYQGIGATAGGLVEALDSAKAKFYEFESAIEDAADFIQYQAGS